MDNVTLTYTNSSTSNPITIIICIFAILVILSVLYEDSLSLYDYQLDIWKGIFTIFFGGFFTWGLGFVINQDWGNFILILFILLGLGYGIFRSIKRKRSIQDKFKNDVFDWIESIKDILTKEIRNEGDKNREINNQILDELKRINNIKVKDAQSNEKSG